MRYKIFIIIIVILISVIGIQPKVIAANHPKTILVILDKFSLDLVKSLDNQNTCIGLINNRTSSIYAFDGKVSQLMTLSIGRRVKAEDNLFKGIENLNNGRLRVKGFTDILLSIRKNSKTFIEDKFLMGEYLKTHGINTGYIGNDSSAILAVDKNGIIEFGVNEIKYEKEWLIENTIKLFNNCNLVVLGYEVSNNKDRKKLLLDYLQELKGINLMVASFNQLSPIAYKSYQCNGGTINSDTTKRLGIISNLDILPHIAHIYGLNNTFYIGSKINTIPSVDAVSILEDNFLQSYNLNTIKYILHGLIILFQLFVVLYWKIRKNINPFIYTAMMNSILFIILLSFILGLFKIYSNIILYLIILIILSVTCSVSLSDKFGFYKFPLSYIISAGIYLVIIYGVFINDNILYTSFMGYNNILIGGRFYGLNNGIAGVFLAASILFYYILRKKFKSQKITKWLLLIIPAINIIALSGRYGANIGGYFTAVILFVFILHENYVGIKSRKLKLLLIVVIISSLFIANFYIDIISTKNSHAGDLILRIKDHGFIELINILTIKIKQIIFMTLLSPWVIILIGQIFFIKSNYNRISKVKEAKMIFYVSVIGLLINDTGIITFTYMNTFLIASLSSLHNIEKRDFS